MSDKNCTLNHRELLKETKSRILEDEEYEYLSLLFKMFGDKSRIKILHCLQGGEMCVCALAEILGVTKSAVSHQLKSLRLANLVKSRRDGQNIFYSLADEHVDKIIKIGLEHIEE